MGDDASVQPGRMQEVILHETAVARIRGRLTSTAPSEPWLCPDRRYAEGPESARQARNNRGGECAGNALPANRSPRRIIPDPFKRPRREDKRWPE